MQFWYLLLSNSQITAVTMRKRPIMKALNSEANASLFKPRKSPSRILHWRKKKVFHLITFTEDIFNGKLDFLHDCVTWLPVS